MRSRSPGNKAGADDAGAAIDIERLFHSVQIISGSFDTLDDGLRGRVGKLVSWLNDKDPSTRDAGRTSNSSCASCSLPGSASPPTASA